MFLRLVAFLCEVREFFLQSDLFNDAMAYSLSEVFSILTKLDFSFLKASLTSFLKHLMPEPNSLNNTFLPNSLLVPSQTNAKSLRNTGSKIWYLATSIGSFDSHHLLSLYLAIARKIFFLFFWVYFVPYLFIYS